MKWGLVLLVAAVGLGLVGFGWWSQQVRAPSPGNKEKVAFVVTRDQTGNQIISSLARLGLIRSQPAARIYLYVAGLQNRLQAGSFVLTRNMALSEVFTALTGQPADVWVTIPEGWRREQIAARLQATLADVGTSFNAEEFLQATANLEGQLFPDTYLIPVGATAADVVRIMTTNFTAKAQLDLPNERRTLIVASLVEREANSDTDRPTIAGILLKRLAAGWPLQVDSTVQYTTGDPGDWWPKEIDTKISSPYNTYLQAGLPPTPIANPGLASITATKNPTQTPYWYYLHAPDGAVYYAQSLTEHNANIDKYLKSVL